MDWHKRKIQVRMPELRTRMGGVGHCFFNSRRISGHDRCARTNKAKSQLLGLEALHEFAKSQGANAFQTNMSKGDTPTNGVAKTAIPS